MRSRLSPVTTCMTKSPPANEIMDDIFCESMDDIFRESMDVVQIAKRYAPFRNQSAIAETSLP